MAKTKQKSRAGKKVSVFFIVFIIIEMLLVAGTAYVFRNEDVTPSFAGYSMFVMDSENMNGIPKDALFVVENGSPSKDQIGKPVLCENVPEIGSSIFLLLDITAKGENVTGVYYVVSQDDGTQLELKSSDVIGVAPTYYITAGKIIRFVSSPVGIAACAIVPILIWILLEIIIAIASRPAKRDDDNKYDEVEESLTLDDVLYDQTDTSPLKFTKDETIEEMIDDITFAQEEAKKAEEAVEVEEITEAAGAEEVTEVTEDAPEEAEPEVEAEQTKRIVDVDETISSTRKAASDSLEELMKMMEEEQKKLKEQLSK